MSQRIPRNCDIVMMKTFAEYSRASTARKRVVVHPAYMHCGDMRLLFPLSSGECTSMRRKKRDPLNTGFGLEASEAKP